MFWLACCCKAAILAAHHLVTDRESPLAVNGDTIHSRFQFTSSFSDSVMQDLTKDVFRIDAIPSQSLDTVREWLSSMDVKFYENKVNLNWKAVLKSIIDVSPHSCGA